MVLLVVFGARPALAVDLPRRVPIELRHTHVQTLPHAVRDVLTSPTGKAWLVFDAPEGPWSLEQAKAVVEREFERPQPQIIGLNLLGWGRDGRGWFTFGALANSETHVIGYDGETWVTQENSANIVGPPVVVNGYEIFPGRTDVAVYNGREWWRSFPLAGTTLPAQIVAEPDGAGAVAYFNNQVHRFRDGQWVATHVDAAIGTKISAIAATRFGVLGQVEHKLVEIAPPVDEAQIAKADQLFAGLRKKLEDSELRATAAQELIALGPAVLDLVKRNTESVEDPELRVTLRRVALRIEQQRPVAPAEQAKAPGTTLDLGAYRVSSTSFLHQLPGGEVLVGVEAGENIELHRPLKPGLLVIPPRAPPFYIDDDRINNCGLVAEYFGLLVRPPPAPLPMGPRVFRIPGHPFIHISYPSRGSSLTRPANPALVLDLDRRTLSVDSDEYVLAIDAQQRRYVVVGGDWARRVRPTAIDVVTPGAPDERLFIKLSAGIELEARSYGWGGMARGAFVALDNSGNLYAQVKAGPLRRYDGKTWHDIAGTEDLGSASVILISGSGAIACEVKAKARLIWDGQVHEAASLEQLVEQHQAVFAEQFRGGSLCTKLIESAQIVVDGAGQIWLRRHHDVSVYTGRAWIKDDDGRLRGSRENSRFRFMAAVEDGSAIYISNLIGDPPVSYFAKVVSDTIERTDAPHSYPAEPLIRGVRDAQGALWGPSAAERSDANKLPARHAIRITPPVPNRAPLRIEGQGYPVLNDGAGNLVFFLGMTSHRETAINIVRDGKVVRSIPTPELTGLPWFTSDRPGSIYTASVRGLVHITAKDAKRRPRDYHLEGVYPILGVDQQRTEMVLASPLKYLALVRVSPERVTLHTLALPLSPIKVPTEDELVEQLRGEARALLDQFPNWGAMEPLKSKLKEYSPQVQVRALLPLIDYRWQDRKNQPGQPVVCRLLGERWEHAWRSLVAMLDDNVPMRRAAAACAIGEMWFRNQGMDSQPWAREAGPKLAALLSKDPSPLVRVEAARTLGSLGDSTARAAHAIIKALDAPELRERQMALSAMSKVGPDGWSAVPRLIQIVKEPGEMSRNEAINALASMGPAARDAVPVLLEVCSDPLQRGSDLYASNALFRLVDHALDEPPPVRLLAQAIRHCEYGGPAWVACVGEIDDAQIAAALAEALENIDSPDSGTGRYVLRALRKTKSGGQPVTDYLLALAESNRPHARAWAAVAWGERSGNTAQAVRMLQRVMQDASSSDRTTATMAGAELGPVAKDLLAHIAPNLSDRFPWEPLQLIKSYYLIAGRPDRYLDYLAQLTPHRQENDASEDAAGVLAILGPMADPQTPTIAANLEDYSRWARHSRFHAARVLRSIGPTERTRAALPALGRMLDPDVEASPYNRRIAAEAIWAITRDADLVARSLAATLDDRGANFFWTVRTLERMGPSAAAAIPRLKQAAGDDPNPHFRAFAARALKTIQAPPPAAGADFDRWYQELADEDETIAVDAVWRFAQAGPAAESYLTQRTNLMTPQRRQQIVAALSQLLEQMTNPRRAQPEEAIDLDLAALQRDLDGLDIELQDGAVQLRIKVAGNDYPYPSLEQNRQYARAVQALKLSQSLRKPADRD